MFEDFKNKYSLTTIYHRVLHILRYFCFMTKLVVKLFTELLPESFSKCNGFIVPFNIKNKSCNTISGFKSYRKNHKMVCLKCSTPPLNINILFEKRRDELPPSLIPTGYFYFTLLLFISRRWSVVRLSKSILVYLQDVSCTIGILYT